MALNRAIKPIQPVEQTVDIQSKSTALVSSASTDLATILGEAVSALARGVEVYITGTGDVHYSPTGTASAAEAIIPTQKTLFGKKEDLDTMEFFSTGTPTMNVIVFGDKQ